MRTPATRLDRGAGRFTRGLTMSAACFAIPAVAHAAASGGIPIHAGFILAIVLLSVACVALADRRRNATEITALLLASQPAFHVLLTLGSHHHGATLIPGWTMLLAHITAALTLGVLLGGVETAVWSLATLSATVLLVRVRRLWHPIPSKYAVARPVWQRTPMQPRFVRQIVTSIPLRGPPALV